jgi:hypothetical protein
MPHSASMTWVSGKTWTIQYFHSGNSTEPGAAPAAASPDSASFRGCAGQQLKGGGTGRL